MEDLTECWLNAYSIPEIHELIREGVIDATYPEWIYCNSQWADTV